MATQQDILKNFVSSLDKTNLRVTSAVDEAIKSCSKFTSYTDLIDHFLADRNNSASGDDFLKRYCGINLDNADTGAITGSDAGGSVVKTAESIVPENSSGASIYPPSNSFSYKGLTVNVPSASTLSENQKNIVAGLYSWWLKAGLDLVEETYGFSFEDSDVTCKIIDVDFDMSGYPNLGSYFHYTPSGAMTKNIILHINSNFYNTLKNSDPNSDPNGSSNSSDIPYLDRELTMDLTKILLMSKINYEFELPSTVGKGLTALVDGVDDRHKTEIIELINDTQKLERFSLSNSQVDTGIYDTNKYDFTMGYMLLRYLAKQEADPTPVEVNIPANAFEYNGHSYYIYSGVAQTWEEAQTYCQALGGHLMVINDAAENTALFNYMKSSGYGNAYFGFSDVAQEGNWQWVDGTSATYTNWTSGEPNGSRYENYGMFYKDFSDGKWNDGSFTYDVEQHTANFICEWDSVKSSESDTQISGLGSSIINTLKKMNNDEFKDFIGTIKNVANGLTKLEDLEIASLGKKPFKISAIVGDTIEYLEDLQSLIVHSSDTGLSASANFEKLSSSSIKEFASIYDLLNEFSSASDTSIWGETAEKNVAMLTLAADLLSVKAAITDTRAGYEEEGIKAAILSCGEVFKNLGKVAEDIYKSTVTSPTKKGPWNAVNFYAALVNSAWNIFEQSYKSHQRYYADGKWSFDDTARFLMDVSISGLYGITHTLLEENDDLFWDIFLGDEYKDSDLSYPEQLSDALAHTCEKIGDALRQFNSNVVEGLKDLWNQLKSFQYGVGVGLNVAFSVGSVIFNILAKSSSKSVTYLDENGNVLSSSKNAVASITIENGKSTFKTLKNVQQILSLGSEKDTRNWIINTKDGNDNITVDSSKDVTIKSGNGDDMITMTGNANANINAEKGNDRLYGGFGNDLLNAGAGNDVLSGGMGNDTLTGGSGNDIFVYEGGNDVITDYKTGENKIKLVSSEITSSSVSGSNIILTTSAGNITVKGCKDKTITVIDSSDVETSQLYGRMNYSADKKTLSLTSAFTGTLDISDYVSTVKKIDAISTSKAIKIYGNSQANTIFGGKGADTIFGGTGKDSIFGNAGADKLYGEAGNDSLYGGDGNDSLYGEVGHDKLFGEAGSDTLIGGAGSDTLTGGAGKDVFVYGSGDGKDTITDYTAGEDKIKITSGSISSYSFNGADVVFTVGTGSITVKDGKSKKITVVDSAGKTSTKAYSNSISGRSALWFADDDNFITNDTGFDSILQVNPSEYSTENKLSLTTSLVTQPNDSLSSVVCMSEVKCAL